MMSEYCLHSKPFGRAANYIFVSDIEEPLDAVSTRHTYPSSSCRPDIIRQSTHKSRIPHPYQGVDLLADILRHDRRPKGRVVRPSTEHIVQHLGSHGVPHKNHGRVGAC